MDFHRFRIILLAIFCISLALVVVTFLKRSDFDAPQKASVEAPAVSQADLTIQTVRMVEQKGGRTEWQLEADSSETFQDKNLTLLKNVRATFYPEGRPVIYVEGREGHFRTDTKNMTVRGDVVVRSDAGYALRTEELRYDASKRQVETDQPVEMSQEGLVVKGVGLSTNLDGKSLTVRRDVEATFQ